MIFERLSTVYDVDWGKWPRRYIPLIQAVLRELDIARARVLDLACGTGTLALELAKLGHEVLGVDISPKMIGYAEDQRRQRGLDNVRFLCADAGELSDLGDNEFEQATLVMGLHEMPTEVRPRVLGEVAREGPISLRRNMRVVDVLATAGGFSAFADKDRVLIIREGQEVLAGTIAEIRARYPALGEQATLEDVFLPAMGHGNGGDTSGTSSPEGDKPTS